MNSPKVVEGYRGPRSEREAGAPSGPGSEAGIPAGKTVIQFKTVRYRLQLTAPVNAKLTDGRILDGERAKVVQADNGFVILDNVKDAETIALLRGHVHYGVDFWDFDTVLQKASSQQREQAINTLKDPTQRALILDAIRTLHESGDADFQLPSAGHPVAQATRRTETWGSRENRSHAEARLEPLMPTGAAPILAQEQARVEARSVPTEAEVEAHVEAHDSQGGAYDTLNETHGARGETPDSPAIAPRVGVGTSPQAVLQSARQEQETQRARVKPQAPAEAEAEAEAEARSQVALDEPLPETRVRARAQAEAKEEVEAKARAKGRK